MVPTPTSPFVIKTPEKQVQGKLCKLERAEFFHKKLQTSRAVNESKGMYQFRHFFPYLIGQLAEKGARVNQGGRTCFLRGPG